MNRKIIDTDLDARLDFDAFFKKIVTFKTLFTKGEALHYTKLSENELKKLCPIRLVTIPIKGTKPLKFQEVYRYYKPDMDTALKYGAKQEGSQSVFAYGGHKRG